MTTLRAANTRHHSLRHALLASALVLLLVGIASSGHAEFIQTMSTGVYQSVDGKTKVIISNQENAQGIFVVHLNNGVSPQEFNPEKIPVKDSTHIFIRFDPTAEHGYSELIIGGKSYKITGNLTVALTEDGSVAVNIDNTNPYLSITTRGSGKERDSLIGFYGISEVVRGEGPLAAILTANQLNAEIARVIKPYTIKNDRLWLNGKELDTPTIGVFVKREHPCLTPATSIITLEQLKAIRAIKDETQQARTLEQYLRRNTQAPPTQGHLVLRAEPNAPIVMLNVATKNVLDLRSIKNAISSKKICVLSPIS